MNTQEQTEERATMSRKREIERDLEEGVRRVHRAAFDLSLAHCHSDLDAMRQATDAIRNGLQIVECARSLLVEGEPNRRLGPAQLVDFTERDGSVTQRRMRPVLDEHGGTLRWLPAEAP